MLNNANTICFRVLLVCSRYIKAAARDGIGMLAVQDKTVFDNYISGTLSDEQLPKDVVDPLETLAESSAMKVDEKEEPSDFAISAAVASAVSSFSESEVVSMVLDRERSVHNAKSLLIAPAKDFKLVLSSQIESKSSSASSSGAVKPAHDRYQARPEQDYYRNIGLGTDDIDTRGSMFLSAGERSVPAMTPSSVSTPSSGVKGAKPSSVSSSRDKRPGGDLVESEDAKRAKTGLKPIIVVPGIASSPVNRFNMLKFFGESTFVAIDPNDPSLDDNAPHRQEFERVKEDGERVPYEVVDSTVKFTSADWERVIAIFTIGKLWQFKAYPYKDERIADMFQKHCGFYIRLGSEKIPQDTIAKWKVKIITVSKSHRHADAATLREFWDAIDDFVKTSKIHHLRT